jgi:hypothetical protein
VITRMILDSEYAQQKSIGASIEAVIVKPLENRNIIPMILQ